MVEKFDVSFIFSIYSGLSDVIENLSMKSSLPPDKK